jgi:catechol 2,3-dioxygenase-like lactoylglutathione lyase family enzyme
MAIQTVHHLMVTIPVSAEDEARAFYCGLLGLPEIPKPDSLSGRGGLWVEVGALQLHLGVEDGVNRSATKAHVAYQVDNLAEWRTHLALSGVVMLDSVPIPGYRRFECRDPFGNRIEFIEPLSS